MYFLSQFTSFFSFFLQINTIYVVKLRVHSLNEPSKELKILPVLDTYAYTYASLCFFFFFFFLLVVLLALKLVLHDRYDLLIAVSSRRLQARFSRREGREKNKKKRKEKGGYASSCCLRSQKLVTR